MQKKTQISIKLFAVSFLLLNNCSPETNTKLSMEKAVNMSYQYNPSLKALKYSTQASKESEKVAMSGYLPTVNIKETPYINSGFMKTNGIHNRLSLEASQLVFSFSGPLQERDIAKKQTYVSKLSEEEKKDFLRFNVETSFLQSWLLQRKNKLIKNLSLSADQNVKKSEHANKLNLLDRNVWLKDEANYAASMANVYLYPDDLSNAQNQLEFFIGKKFNDKAETITLIWDSKQEIKLENLQSYYQKAYKNRKDIKRKQKEIEEKKATEYLFQKGNSPELRVVGTYSKEGRYDETHTVGAYFSWNLSDGGRKHHEQQRAHANMLKTMEEKETAIQQARRDVQKSYNDLSILLKQLLAQDVQVTQAKNEFILNKQKYEIGDISKVDFDQSKYNWENQKFIWLTLKIQTAMKERELQYACGYPE